MTIATYCLRKKIQYVGGHKRWYPQMSTALPYILTGSQGDWVLFPPPPPHPQGSFGRN